MSTNNWNYYELWKSIIGLSNVKFDFDNMCEEDFVLAEAMAGEGLDKLIELKTQILNAKSKLQTPDLQRGVLPPPEEGKEDVCIETVAAETVGNPDKKNTFKEKWEKAGKPVIGQQAAYTSK